MHDDFGIAVGIKRVTAGFEFLPQCGEVVDFAVKDHPHAVIFVMNWLASAREVNNAQATHAQAHRAPGVDSLVVRPAVHDRLAHAVNLLGMNLLVGPAHHARYSAHRGTSTAAVRTSCQSWAE